MSTLLIVIICIVIFIISFFGGCVLGVRVRFEEIKKLKETIAEREKEIVDLRKPKEPEKPKKIHLLQNIIVTNNKTDREIIFENETPFGLSWEFTKDNALVILQYINEKKDYLKKGVLLDFSIKNVVYEEKEN